MTWEAAEIYNDPVDYKRQYSGNDGKGLKLTFSNAAQHGRLHVTS